MRLIKKWFGKEKTFKGKTALALGGGGARGVAHLGVLKYLEDNGYVFDFIVGTSAGAVFGALYLLNRDSDEAYEKLTEVLDNLKAGKKLVNMTKKKSSILVNVKKKLNLAKALFKTSILEGGHLREFLAALVGEDTRFDDLKESLYAVATDLKSGKDVVFSRGKLLTPLAATSSIPGAFPPVAFNNYCLIDGGTTCKLPSRIARAMGAARVMAVDVGSPFLYRDKFTTANEVILRSEKIASAALNHQNRQAADLLLSPSFGDFMWYEYRRHREAFDAGYREALEKAKEIDSFFKARPGRDRKKAPLPANDFILE